MTIKAWLEIEIRPSSPFDHRTIELEFNLNDNACPQTCENFRLLCRNTYSDMSDGPTIFSAFSPGLFIQGGLKKRKYDSEPKNFAEQLRRDGECAWGGQFKDENYVLKHDRAGLLGMATRDKNMNGCQFYITLVQTEEKLQELAKWDARSVVFRELVDGVEGESWKGLQEISERFSVSQGKDEPYIIQSGADDGCVWKDCPSCPDEIKLKK